MADGVDLVEATEKPIGNPFASKKQQAENWEKVSAEMRKNTAILKVRKQFRDGQREADQKFQKWAIRDSLATISSEERLTIVEHNVPEEEKSA